MPSALGGQAAISFLPAGSMVDFAGTTAPSGWLMCDGSAVSRTVYASLFSALGTAYGVGDGSTTFNLPDYRGRFARYLDNMGTAAGAAGRDTGRAHGSAQADAMQGHKHAIIWQANFDNGQANVAANGTSASSNFYSSPINNNLYSDGTNGTPRTAAETRPVNLASYRIIKY